MKGLSLTACVVFLIGSATAALGQIPSEIINQLPGIAQTIISQAVQAEWAKLPRNEYSCVNEKLRGRGESIQSLAKRMILPSDSRVSHVRFQCHTELSSGPPSTSQQAPTASTKPPTPATATTPPPIQPRNGPRILGQPGQHSNDGNPSESNLNLGDEERQFIRDFAFNALIEHARFEEQVREVIAGYRTALQKLEAEWDAQISAVRTKYEKELERGYVSEQAKQQLTTILQRKQADINTLTLKYEDISAFRAATRVSLPRNALTGEVIPGSRTVIPFTFVFGLPSIDANVMELLEAPRSFEFQTSLPAFRGYQTLFRRRGPIDSPFIVIYIPDPVKVGVRVFKQFGLRSILFPPTLSRDAILQIIKRFAGICLKN